MVTETITADTDWVVPDGVFSVTVTLEGERGGSDDYTGTDYGGPGGRVVGELEVRPGEVLYIRETPGGTGAADGGDAIDVRTNGTSLEDRIAIAAGGGAGGEGSQTGQVYGGAGGPDTGEDGEYSGSVAVATGGTQSAGGSGGGDDGSGGSFGAGGDGGTTGDNNGHGGGAGLYGGGGGASNSVFGGVGGSGAGGSNYDDGLDSVSANERGTSTRSHGLGGLVTVTYEETPGGENVAITDTTATSNTLSWDAPTLPPEVDSLDLYRVYRDLDAGSVRTDYAEVATRDPGQTTYDDVGLLNGRTYHYRVGADLTAPELDERDKPTATPDSVVHHWRFAEGSGSTVVDEVGNADITLSGPTWESDSRYEGGTAPLWDRTDDTASATPTQPTERSWAVRVNADSLGTSSPTNRSVISHDFQPQLLYNVNDGDWRAQDGAGTPATVSEAQSTVESDVQRILIVRADSSTFTLEVYDGSKSLVGTDSFSSPDLSTYESSDMYFGHEGTGGRLWGGVIDQIYIANASWSDSERDEILEQY